MLKSASRILAMIGLAATTVLVPVEKVAACDCAMTVPEQSLAFADAAFTGTVVGVEGGGVFPGAAPGIAVTAFSFEVDGVAKGTVASSEVVVSFGDSASCGTSFAMDERWLVFGLLDGTTLTTGLCSGNLMLRADEEPPVPVVTPSAAGASRDELRIPAPVLLAAAAALGIGAVSIVAFRRAERRLS